VSDFIIPIPARLKRFINRKSRLRILFLGGSDTGKTTLLGSLARYFSGRRIGLIDADPGQSHIGPPATVGWTRLRQPFEGWESLHAVNIYFVGATSPYGNLLPMLAGIVRALNDLAEEDLVLIDTSGFISGSAARALIWHSADVVGPDIIVALQRSGELEGVLAGLSLKKNSLVKLPVAPSVRGKPPGERRTHRVNCYERYFKDARMIKLDADALSLRREPNRLLERGTVVSLRDDSGRDLALGIIEEAGPENLKVLTPLSEGQKVACLISGRIRLSREDNWQEGAL